MLFPYRFLQELSTHAAGRAGGRASRPSPTCDVVGDPAVSRLAALAQTTVPLMQQANVVLREAWPEVLGRNCDNNHTLM